jgi:hypothetical protein
MSGAVDLSTSPAAVTRLSRTKTISPFAQFFQDTDGKLSATRLVMIIWAFGVLIVWGFVTLKTGTLTELPNSVVEILGIVLTGKVVQKFGENSSP